jgi:hypothetical protein
MRPEDAMFPGPLTRPWKEPKVLTNVARLSRGPWRIAAAFDRSGLVPSQAFFGIWSTSEALPVEALEAIINGPLTNAFLTEHASNQHFTNELLKQLPLPRLERIPPILDALRRYHTARDQIRGYALQPVGADDQLAALLVDVDAAVLKAYDLSPRLERRLLEFFRGYEQDRRLDHAFKGWIPRISPPISLFTNIQANWCVKIWDRGPWRSSRLPPKTRFSISDSISIKWTAICSTQIWYRCSTMPIVRAMMP